MPNVHTIPINDLIDHLTGSGEDCPCGPTVVPIEREDGSVVFQYIHHSLDGRENMTTLASRRPDEQPSITCPICKMTSYHPQDIAFGYCGNCHAFTGGMVDVMVVEEGVVEAAKNWDWMPWPAKVVAIVILVLLVLGLLWLLIWGEV